MNAQIIFALIAIFVVMATPVFAPRAWAAIRSRVSNARIQKRVR